jgi:hypothetical protein
MLIVEHKRPQKILKFTKSTEKHMPAPTIDTALKCNVCRECHYVVDVEQGKGIDSFTI